MRQHVVHVLDAAPDSPFPDPRAWTIPTAWSPWAAT